MNKIYSYIAIVFTYIIHIRVRENKSVCIYYNWGYNLFYLFFSDIIEIILEFLFFPLSKKKII